MTTKLLYIIVQMSTLLLPTVRSVCEHVNPGKNWQKLPNSDAECSRDLVYLRQNCILKSIFANKYLLKYNRICAAKFVFFNRNCKCRFFHTVYDRDMCAVRREYLCRRMQSVNLMGMNRKDKKQINTGRKRKFIQSPIEKKRPTSFATTIGTVTAFRSEINSIRMTDDRKLTNNTTGINTVSVEEMKRGALLEKKNSASKNTSANFRTSEPLLSEITATEAPLIKATILTSTIPTTSTATSTITSTSTTTTNTITTNSPISKRINSPTEMATIRKDSSRTDIEISQNTNGNSCDFRCEKNRICLQQSQLCNGQNDCGEGAEDESAPNCPGHLLSGAGLQCHRLTHRCPGKSICTPLENFCDGHNDCGDGYDERADVCLEKIDCPLNRGWFRCALSYRCIPDIWLCDGHSDCEKGNFADKSDESPLVCLGKDVCWHMPYLYKCQNVSQCVLRSNVCDGRVDCADGSDEVVVESKSEDNLSAVASVVKRTAASCEVRPKKCANGQFECGANRPFGRRECIESSQVCDGTKDCLDGADESPNICPRGHSVDICNPFEFECVSGGYCLPKGKVCDGWAHCLDGSDEINCPPFSCRPDQYRCRSERRCILNTWICDGQPDCQGKDDEENCLIRPRFSPFGTFFKNTRNRLQISSKKTDEILQFKQRMNSSSSYCSVICQNTTIILLIVAILLPFFIRVF